MGMLRSWRWEVAYLGVLVRSCAVRLVFVRLLDLQDGVAPSEGERKFRVRMENCLPIVVKHRDIPVRVVKFLALLPLMDCRVGCRRVV